MSEKGNQVRDAAASTSAAAASTLVTAAPSATTAAMVGAISAPGVVLQGAPVGPSAGGAAPRTPPPEVHGESRGARPDP